MTGTSAAHVLDLLRSIASAPEDVEIDLSRVTRVDRSGATVILDAYVATLLRHRAFAVSGPSPACRLALERFGVFDVVDLIDAQTTTHGLARH